MTSSPAPPSTVVVSSPATITAEQVEDVVVATLEAVQSQLRVGVRWSFLAVDEYQWLGDSHRGNHYEGALASLPRGVQLLLLSGSVANPNDVATQTKDWRDLRQSLQLDEAPDDATARARDRAARNQGLVTVTREWADAASVRRGRLGCDRSPR